MKVGPKYIKQITLKSVQHFILDEKLTDDFGIKLNPKNFDDLILEYRTIYGNSFQPPFNVLGLSISEDKNVPLDRIIAENNFN